MKRLGWWGLLVGVTAYWISLRFILLEQSPPGFYLDEAVGAANIMCLEQSGKSVTGQIFPLFPTGLSGGNYSPVYSYFGVLWIKIFGSSIASFRAISAFATALSLLALYFLGKHFFSTRVGVLMMAIGAASPWSFQFSRIAWDPPWAVTCTLWGLVFLLSNQKRSSAIFAGVLFSLATYAYSPARVLLLLLLPATALLLFPRNRQTLVRFAWVLLAAFITTLPLFSFMLNSTGMNRFHQVSILSPHYIQSQAEGSYLKLLGIFLKNFFAHFSREYLFLKGDANLRHSIQTFGEWSKMDLAGAILALYFFFKQRFYRKGLFTWLVIAYSGAIIPAALTWDGVPHALRSLLAWPFLAMLAGWGFWQLEKIKPNAGAAFLLILMVIHSLQFVPDYFREYPLRSPAWFEANLVSSAKRVPFIKEKFLAESQDQDPMTQAYFLMHYGKESCASR